MSRKVEIHIKLTVHKTLSTVILFPSPQIQQISIHYTQFKVKITK